MDWTRSTAGCHRRRNGIQGRGLLWSCREAPSRQRIAGAPTLSPGAHQNKGHVVPSTRSGWWQTASYPPGRMEPTQGSTSHPEVAREPMQYRGVDEIAVYTALELAICGAIAVANACYIADGHVARIWQTSWLLTGWPCQLPSSLCQGQIVLPY